MFKKTLAAVAVLGAFAGTAMAANVTLYGVVDEAVAYQYAKADGQSKSDQVGLISGGQSGSRWGLKGTEELGNGLTVGFQLESGFGADDGTLGQSFKNDKEEKYNRIFGRQATVYVDGAFGQLGFGRVGTLDSGLGSYSFIYNYVALGTGWGANAGSKSLWNFGYADRADNTVTYVSPNFAGVKLYAQYSFAVKGAESEHTAQNNRYAGLGAKYDLGAFSTGLVLDTYLKRNVSWDKAAEKYKHADVNDQYKVSWGASYDFGVAKVMGMVQYGKHMDKIVTAFGDDDAFDGDIEGYNASLGVSAPVMGGTALAQVNYIHGKDKAAAEGDSDKLDGYGIGGGYSYPLSKRTSIYGYAGYGEFKTKGGDDNGKLKAAEAGVGLTHKF